MESSDPRLQTICLLTLTVIVCGAVLHWLQIVFMPFVLAIFISLGLSAVVKWQVQKLRFPAYLAVSTTLLLTLVLFWLVGLLVVNSVEQMVASAGLYETRINDLIQKLFKTVRLGHLGLEIEQWTKSLEHFQIQSLILDMSASILDVLSLSLMVFLYVIYLLFVFAQESGEVGVWHQIAGRIKAYLFAKAMISATVGLAIGMVLSLCHIQSAMAFGLFSTLLNFIPYAGPLIASLAPWPVILLSPALSTPAMLVSLFFPGILFTIVGNFVEPKVLGRSMQLHPLVVLLALMFWGVLWGPIGVLLATPITGVLALLSSYLPLTRPIANVLAGKI
jgi:AI-2 transport protein TqsA